MCDECTWHHKTFLMQLYWYWAIKLYCYIVLYFGYSGNIYTTEALFRFKSDLLRAQPCWFSLYQWRAEKGWLVMHLISDTFATHAHDAGLVNGITDTDCWAWNGSIRNQVFKSIKHWFLTNRTRNWVKKVERICFILFLLAGPMMVLQSGSPLST